MNLIDLAFINKFANSQSSEENSSSNVIYKKQNGPRITTEQPVVGQSFNFNQLIPVSRILITKDDTFHPVGGLPIDSEITFYDNDIKIYTIPAGLYIVFHTDAIKEITPYICKFTNNDYLYEYESIKPWDGQIDEWTGYSNKIYGFTMPDLNSDNTVLMFYVHDKTR